jgi:hypothetical protein
MNAAIFEYVGPDRLETAIEFLAEHNRGVDIRERM